MKSIVAICVMAVTLQGCTVIDAADYAVSRYCSVPNLARIANREAVALAVAPNRIEIECARDAVSE